MKRIVLSFLLTLTVFVSSWGADSGWYLYLYSEANGLNGDAGQFKTTANDNVLLLENFDLTASGINFCVHNSGWSQIYGWDAAAVSTVGETVTLATTTQATGWLSIPAGTYDVTFNLATLTICFDGHGSTDLAISYTTYPDGHALATVSDYLRGGDISMLNYVEDLGAKFYDANGNERDALDILAENGVNIVRLRLYNEPGNAVSYKVNNTTYNYALPAGYLDEDDILKLARRAKAHNMKIELTFHYSDFWTNGEMQFKPKAWEDYTFNELKSVVHDYTYNFLQRMNAQGTAPDYVSLGNEIQGGLLFGYYTSDKAQVNAVNGYCDNMANVAALLAEGSSAVRSACPQSKVVIHLTLSEAVTSNTYQWFFDAMKQYALDYDVIGASYYPYWTNQRPSMLTDLANTMYQRYGKDLLVMETGYSWTQYRPSGRYGSNYEGQLHLNGTPYNEATQAGQKAFIEELQSVVKANNHILGYLYWDPVMVEQKVGDSWIQTTWAMKKSGGQWWQDGNTVGNTTWFDYDGKALPVLEAVAEDKHTVPSEVTIDGTTYTVEQQPPYILNMSAVGYSTFYDTDARLNPEGLTTYTAKSAIANRIELEAIDQSVIPAETAVLLKGDEGTYYLWSRSGGLTVDENLFYGSVIEQEIAAPAGNYHYYKLANDSEHGLGWYWGAADGGVFTNGAHKAYLALPQGSAARSFIPLFGEESTRVKYTESTGDNLDAIYNLHGQRTTCPSKGLCIKNGKKVIIK